MIVIIIIIIVVKGSEDDDVEVPPHVLELVAMDNSLFEHWVTQVKTFRVRKYYVYCAAIL